MKIFTKMGALALLVLSLSGCAAGKYMASYALTPKFTESKTLNGPVTRRIP